VLDFKYNVKKIEVSTLTALKVIIEVAGGLMNSWASSLRVSNGTVGVCPPNCHLAAA